MQRLEDPNKLGVFLEKQKMPDWLGYRKENTGVSQLSIACP